MKPRSYGQGSLGLWRLTGAKAATIVTVAMKSGEPAIGGSQLRRRGTLCTQFASWTNVFRIAKVDLREQDREEQESPPCKSLHRSPKAHAGFILTCFRSRFAHDAYTRCRALQGSQVHFEISPRR